MIKQLLQRPISILLVFVIGAVIGCVAYFLLPNALLPPLEVPRLSIKYEAEGSSEEEIYQNLALPISRRLALLPALKDYRITIAAPKCEINLNFEFGSDLQHQLSLVNEQIDLFQSSSSSTLKRPRVIYSSLVDVPMVKLVVTSKSTSLSHYDLGEYVRKSLVPQLEGKASIVLADANGISQRELILSTTEERLATHGLSVSDIKTQISRQLKSINTEIEVFEGNYVKKLQVIRAYHGPSDLKGIPLQLQEKKIRLDELFEVEFTLKRNRNAVLYQNQPAIVIGLYKHEDYGLARFDKDYNTPHC